MNVIQLALVFAGALFVGAVILVAWVVGFEAGRSVEARKIAGIIDEINRRKAEREPQA